MEFGWNLTVSLSNYFSMPSQFLVLHRAHANCKILITYNLCWRHRDANCHYSQPLLKTPASVSYWLLRFEISFVWHKALLFVFAFPVRWVIFGFFLVLTGGKLKFWILPNLDDEKMGFFDSFRPLHSIEWTTAKKKSKKNAKKPDSSDDVTNDPISPSDPVSTSEKIETETESGTEQPAESDSVMLEHSSV